MTPKEKAEELVKVYYKLLPISASFEYSLNICKQCALIAVDEIINSIVITDLTTAENQFIYWQEVKQEIELL